MKLFRHLRSVGVFALNLFYPPHCAICRTDTSAGEHLCPKCRASASRISSPFCEVCSAPADGQIEGAFTCPSCQERRLHFDCAITAYRSLGVVRESIHFFKYEQKFYLRRVLGEWLADNLEDPRLQAPFDRIVPVPLHPTRQRERGFNQAKVLAQLLARRAAVPMLDALQRIRYTTTQTRLDRETRIQNLRNAFRMRKSVDVRQLHLLLIDDVLTTGSTVDECARVLKDAGAASVRVVAVARG